MKKGLLALLLLMPLAGCAHQQGAYGGGGGGYFADDCLSSYGCYDGIYGRGFSDYVFPVSPQSPARTRVTKVERRTSTRVVHRSAAAFPAVGRAAPARGSTRAAGASTARSAPSSHAGHAGGRR
jgi:hypothetical protein